MRWFHHIATKAARWGMHCRTWLGVILGASTMVSFCPDARALDLPDPLATQEGGKITTAAGWEREGRPRAVRLLAENIYGLPPETDYTVETKLIDKTIPEMEGAGLRREVHITISLGSRQQTLRLLIYLPASAAKNPCPVILTLAKTPFSEYDKWWAALAPNNPDHRLSRIWKSGIGCAMLQAIDLDDDRKDDKFRGGIHGVLDPEGTRPPEAWGSIAAWAWGFSRCIDYMQTDPAIDARRIGVYGFSRWGKAALWAGAVDRRISLVVSLCSGCTGAALSRRRLGETIAKLNATFPHWCCEKYKTYNDKEDILPVDQHFLLAAIAPRPLLVISAEQDLWADPEGERLACVDAEPVYALYSTDPMLAQRVDNKHLKHPLAHHLRPGKHQMTEEDWEAMLTFCRYHWGLTMTPVPSE